MGRGPRCIARMPLHFGPVLQTSRYGSRPRPATDQCTCPLRSQGLREESRIGRPGQSLQLQSDTRSTPQLRNQVATA